ncbi:MAG: hypothetical protein PWQ97_518 [Tepidanaerobacteraceae bacterium]|nr:hypothetical protein [Tepidanaerobacteraceae bacterium]
MEKIGIILRETIKKSGLEKKLMQFQIFLRYENLVGEHIAKVSKPVVFRNNTLFIGVENPIWSHQLHFLKREIIEKLNSIFDEPLVCDIKFQICSLEKHKQDFSSGVKKDNIVELPDKIIKMIYNISSEIKDPELRKKFSELMIKDFKYRKKKEERRCSSI